MLIIAATPHLEENTTSTDHAYDASADAIVGHSVQVLGYGKQNIEKIRACLLLLRLPQSSRPLDQCGSAILIARPILIAKASFFVPKTMETSWALLV